jgi:hypothetical protein
MSILTMGGCRILPLFAAEEIRPATPAFSCFPVETPGSILFTTLF